MGYIEGENRGQIILFPEALDDYVDEDNPIRFIDIFVDSLDTQSLGFKPINNGPGREPYHPKDIIKLYIYGYLNNIRSSRKLERETHRNLELIWLMRKLKPNFKTIADFRKDNKASIKNLFKEFTIICKKLELFGNKLVAIDGSKFKAVNSKENCFTKKQIKKNLEKIEGSINKYLEEINNKDKEESNTGEYLDKDLKLKIKSLEKAKKEFKEMEKHLEDTSETQISLTDSDSRLMKTRHGKDVCYNGQIAVDGEHKLMLDYEITNECNDANQLDNMGLKAKEALGIEEFELVADTGFFNNKQIKELTENGITLYIPEPIKNNSNNEDKKFGKSDFKYNLEKDVYICPANKELTHRENKVENGESYKIYRTNYCKSCPIRDKCTTEKSRGRRIQRWIHEKLIDDMKERVTKNKDKMKKRSQIVEHPFGIIKSVFGFRDFLTKGLESVNAEFGFITLAFNMKRVINIVGVRRMIEVIS